MSLCADGNAWGRGAMTEPFLGLGPFFQVLAGPSERKASFRGRRVGAGGAVLGGCAVGRIARSAAPQAAELGKDGLQESQFQRRGACSRARTGRSEEHTSELQSLMRISYAVFCLKKKNRKTQSVDER